MSFLNFEDHINKYYSELNPNELDIIAYILQNKAKVSNINIDKLAKDCLSSKSSISRLTKKIGFKGFVEFKYSIQQSLKMNEDRRDTDSIGLLTEDIEKTIQLFKNTSIKKLIEALYQANRLYFLGSGWTQKNAINDLSRNFMLSNKDTFFIQSDTEFSEILPRITKKDFVILVSKSGENQTMSEVGQLLQLRAIPSLSITAFKDNALAKLTQFNLYYVNTSFKEKRNSIHLKQTFLTLHLLLDLLFREYVNYKNELEEIEAD